MLHLLFSSSDNIISGSCELARRCREAAHINSSTTERTISPPTSLRLRGEGGNCLLCNDLENLVHAFFTCPHSSRAGLALLGWVQVVDGQLLPEDPLTLNLNTDLPPNFELVAVFMVATDLKFMWESRVAKKILTPFLLRAEIEAKISLMRRTILANIATIIHQ